MTSLDWHIDSRIILQQTILAISEYSAGQCGEPCAFLAFGVNYFEGWVSINFDSLKNSIRRARKNAFRTRQWQEAVIRRENGWQVARDCLANNRMSVAGMEVGLFKHRCYKLLSFPNWEEHFSSISEEEDQSGHVLVMFMDVIHQLVALDAFQPMLLSSPFCVGVEFMDDDLGMVVVDIRNWPL